MRKDKTLKVVARMQDYLRAIQEDIQNGHRQAAADKLYEVGYDIERLADQLHMDVRKRMTAP